MCVSQSVPCRRGFFQPPWGDDAYVLLPDFMDGGQCVVVFLGCPPDDGILRGTWHVFHGTKGIGTLG